MFLLHVILINLWILNINLIIIINLSFLKINISYPIILDWISSGFLSWVLLISSVVFIYRKSYIGNTSLNKRFIILVILFIISIALLIISPSLIGIIIGWDGLGITSFLLVIFYQNNRRLKSGIVTIYINRFGDVIIIFSIIIIIPIFTDINKLVKNFYFIIIAILTLAAITKRAQIPFSAWLPIAIAAPTPVSSLVHSSTLVTAGVYLLLRFYFLIKNIFIRNILITISLITRVTAGVIACVESDFKKVIAISTLRQLGLIVFILALNEIKISFFHIISHALFKALLFLSCGIIIIISLSIQDRRFKSNIKSKSYFIPIIFLLSRLRLRGFPFLTGFFSKDLIIERVLNFNNFIITYSLLVISCILTSIYRFRLFYICIKINRSNEKIYQILENKTFYIIIILYTWSIILGKFIFNLIIFSIISIIINIIKIISLFILTAGILISRFKIWLKSKFIINIIREIIFLNFFSSKYFSDSKIFIKNSLDLKWLELIGPSGLFLLRTNTNKKIIFLNKNLNLKFLLLIFVYIYIMIFIFSLSVERSIEDTKVIK